MDAVCHPTGRFLISLALAVALTLFGVPAPAFAELASGAVEGELGSPASSGSSEATDDAQQADSPQGDEASRAEGGQDDDVPQEEDSPSEEVLTLDDGQGNKWSYVVREVQVGTAAVARSYLVGYEKVQRTVPEEPVPAEGDGAQPDAQGATPDAGAATGNGDSGSNPPSGPASDQNTGSDSATEPATEPAPEPEPIIQPTSISLPATIGSGDSVTTIYGIASVVGEDGGNSWDSFKSITVDAGITEVADGAFEGCANLEDIAFERVESSSQKLEKIGERAFAQCPKLTAVTFSTAFKSGIIGERAFALCPKLRSVTFSGASALEEIGAAAFEGCDALQAVTFTSRSALAKFGEGAFRNCRALESVTFSGASALETIGKSAFAQCTRLKSVAFQGDSALKTIGIAAFEGCTSLEEITFKGASALKTICEDAFNGSGLKSFTMPDSLETIAPYAFENCSRLEHVYFNKGVRPFNADGNKAASFYNPFCGSGKVRFHVPAIDGADDLKARNFCPTGQGGEGVLQSRTKVVLYAVSPVAVTDGAFTVSNALYIAQSAFANNAGLASVTFASGVSYINDYAFMFSGLKEVSLPASIRYLGSQCFADCSSLKSVAFASGASVAVPEGCFQGSPVAVVGGGEAVTRIAADAFSIMPADAFPFDSCPNLEFFSANAFAPSSVEGFAYPDRFTEQKAGYCRFDTTVTVSGWKSFRRAEGIIAKVNELRNELQPGTGLQMDADLMDAAMARAAELSVYYSDTTRPLNASFSTIEPKASKEVIVAGFSTWSEDFAVKEVMEYWAEMKRTEDLASTAYHSIGAGCFMQNSVVYWVVLLGTGEVDAAGRERAATYISDNLSQEFMEQIYAVPVRNAPDIVSADRLAITLSSSVPQSALKPGDTVNMVVRWNNGTPDGYKGYPITAKTFDFSIQKGSERIASIDENGKITVKQGGVVNATATLKGTDVSQTLSFTIPAQASITGAKVSGIVPKTYTGAPQVQKPVVTLVSEAGAEQVLEEGFDYTVSYLDNTGAGTGTCVVTGINNYAGAIGTTFSIAQASQSPSVTAKSKTLSLKKVKKAKRIVSAVTVSNAVGAVTYANASTSALGKKLKVNKKTGKITVPKFAKKRTYKAKVKVTAAGNANYRSATKTVSFKIVVK